MQESSSTRQMSNGQSSNPASDQSSDNASESNPNRLISDLEDQVTDLDLRDITPVTSDKFFNHEELSKFDRWNIDSLKARDEIYSSILKCYQEYAKTILTENPARQVLFFNISISLLILSPLQFLLCLYFLRNSENVVPLIASSIEVLGALLVFPKIIAEYLFNTNETTSINNIVAAIQNYDISIRSGIRHTVENHSDQNKDQ